MAQILARNHCENSHNIPGAAAGVMFGDGGVAVQAGVVFSVTGEE